MLHYKCHKNIITEFERVDYLKTHNNRFSWWFLVLGIIQLILAFMMFNKFGLATLTFVYLLATGAILNGIFLLVFRSRINEKTNQSMWILLIYGIISIILGIILLFNETIGLLALPMIVSLMMIFESISIINQAMALKALGRTGLFWFNLIIGIVGIIIGIMLIFFPLAAYFTIELLAGFYFLVFGIRNIISAF